MGSTSILAACLSIRATLTVLASAAGMGMLVCFLLADPAMAAEPICPGGSNPRSDIVWCADFEKLANCGTQGLQCWKDNGFSNTPGGGSYDPNSPYIWKITSGTDAAVGNGFVKSNPQPGSTGSGTNWSPGVRMDTAANYRFYRKMSKGFLSFGSGHGPGIYGTNSSNSCVSVLKYQNSLFSNLVYYPIGCGVGSYNIYPNKPNPPVLRNNRWYLIELQGIMDTACTNPGDPHGCNGVFRLWIDEQLVAEYTNMNFGGVTHGMRWYQVDVPTNYFHAGVPPWSYEIAFDNAVWSSKGTYIGPAANENPRGTADPQSPYLVIDGMEAFLGHRMSGDCAANQGYLGANYARQYRSGGTLQSSVAHGAYPDNCRMRVSTLPAASSVPPGTLYTVTDSSSGTCTSGGGSTTIRCQNTGSAWAATAAKDAAMQVKLTSNSDGGGMAWEKGFIVPSQSVHGWLYLPSSNNYGSITNLALPGFVGDPGGNYSYIALSISGGNWSIRQRSNGGTPQTVATSTRGVTFDTWHEFELILWQNNTLSVMVDRQWLFTNQSLPLSTSYMFQPTGFGAGVAGVVDFQGSAPFTAYFDDANAGSVSFWDCTGWSEASCPFGGSGGGGSSSDEGSSGGGGGSGGGIPAPSGLIVR